MHDYTNADLEPRVRALCDYAVRLTAAPGKVGAEDADLLRSHGWNDAAVERAGKVFNIVKAMCLNPLVLNRSMELYKAIMFGPSELSRAERELLAVVVSTANDCHY